MRAIRDISMVRARVRSIVCGRKLKAAAAAADEAGAARGYWQRYRWIRRLAFLPQGILTLPGPDLAQATTQLREAIHP